MVERLPPSPTVSTVLPVGRGRLPRPSEGEGTRVKSVSSSPPSFFRHSSSRPRGRLGVLPDPCSRLGPGKQGSRGAQCPTLLSEFQSRRVLPNKCVWTQASASDVNHIKGERTENHGSLRLVSEVRGPSRFSDTTGGPRGRTLPGQDRVGLTRPWGGENVRGTALGRGKGTPC